MAILGESWYENVLLFQNAACKYSNLGTADPTYKEFMRGSERTGGYLLVLVTKVTIKQKCMYWKIE